jgi:hypothetical protein
MPKFTTYQRPVVIRVDGDEHTITIRAKLSAGEKAELIRRLGADTRNEPALNTHLLRLGIIAWSGPEFEDVAINDESVAALDLDDPLVQAVIVALMERNYPKLMPTPKPNGASA